MAEYEYAGPHPVTDERNELVHPGDVREFGEEPDWGPWKPTEGAVHGAAGTQAGVEADTQAATALSALPVTPEGNM
jgi:hypothetical protein